MQPDVFESVAPILKAARSVYIATHVSPDGDAIGSSLGLMWALRAMGKQAVVACADGAPPSLHFLPGSQSLVAEPPTTQDVIVALDAGDIERLGAIYSPAAFAGRPLLNIDHHLTNTRFGTVNVVEPQFAAVGEMVHALVRELGAPFDANIAACLLAAMVTDTIGFRTGSTTPSTLRAAADLMESGASLTDVVQHAFESRPLPVLRVWGWVLSRFTVSDGVAWAAIPRRILQKHKLREEEIKGLVNVMRGTQGVKVSILLIESSDCQVKIEFRSNGKVNVADIATALGGGGHKAASGCTVSLCLAEAEQRALSEVRKHM